MRAYITSLLGQRWNVTAVADGTAALRGARDDPPELVLSDVMMPGLDGFQLLRALREDERTKTIPIILLSARAGEEATIEGLQAGADDYLIKPFSFEELLARLRALLRRGPIERPAHLEVADLTLDPATRRVERGGVEIELTPKEFALLEYLMRHAGDVLTRTRIREHVWDWGFDGSSNVVDVYIRYLRHKIDKPFAKELIRTVRGVGYAISAP
jgi:two-component system OmpR family response regulator